MVTFLCFKRWGSQRILPFPFLLFLFLLFVGCSLGRGTDHLPSPSIERGVQSSIPNTSQPGYVSVGIQEGAFVRFVLKETCPRGIVVDRVGRPSCPQALLSFTFPPRRMQPIESQR
ncbi:hypothetical protein IE53DRAFT_195783 [Violaceomyces palustris]|uniref:Uncharacterized protein n=1 Tax=Violaceomyces palustris TaxID=1673888 RepID=A0ACD0NRP1_9BASI|nr:hypothetical protein IE53DRAFT_195783 [Violaceomyces palustris]